MSDDFVDTAITEQGESLLSDLDLRYRTDVSNARELVAQRARVAVTIRPGNTTDRATSFVLGKTTELRRQGMACLATTPTMVGNVFHVAFDRTQLDLSPTLAVCDRCAMLGESSFELHFQFVQPILLPTDTCDSAE